MNSLQEERKQELIKNADNDYRFEEYAAEVLKVLYPATHRSLRDDYEFGTVIIYDSGLFILKTGKEEFERELSQEELFSIFNSS